MSEIQTTPRHYTAADVPDAFRVAAAGIINAHGLRLIRQFEGPPRTKARLCEGGAYELGAGVTFHFDGTRVKEGETCDEAYGEALFVNALKIFARAVDLYVTVPINDNQRAALTAFAYNCGIEALKGSSLLKRVNERRFDDAAVAFGMWIYATKNGHTQALRGLLRRRYAEACLFMSLDWEEATEDDAIALQRRKPTSLPGKDEVISKTPFHQVFAVARLHPLPSAPEVIVITDVRPHVTDVINVSTPNTVPLEVESLQLPEDELLLESVASPDGSTSATATPASTEVASAPEAVRSAPPPVAPASVETRVEQGPPPPKPTIIIAPKQIDPNTADYGAVDIQKGAKNMTDSRRFVGLLIVGLGSLIQVLAARNVVTSLFGAIFFDLSRDPVVLALMAGAVVWFIGLFTKKRGGKVMTTGFVHAEQLLK